MEADDAEDLVTSLSPRSDAPSRDDGRIRVLFVMIQMAMGGSERLVFNLAKNLDRRVFRPSVAWLEQPTALREFEDLRLPLHYVPKQKRIDWQTMRRLAQVVRDERIDVVNAHHFMPFVYSYYAAKVANRTRLIYTEHSEADVLAVNAKWQAVGGRLLRWSDGAVGVSERVSRTLAQHFGLDGAAVHTIENGVDVRLYRGRAHRLGRVRRELGFRDGDIVIGHVANFRRNKNHMFLLQAFRELAQKRQNVKLLLVGKGQDGDPENSEPDVVRFVHENGLGGSVRMLGYRSDVEDILESLDIFCLVSYKEGLPLSLLEAMASGLPVVVSAIEGIQEVVENGANGLSVRPDDVPGLAHALERLIDDAGLRQRIATAARHTVAARYSLDRCVGRTERLLLSMFPARADIAARVPTDPAELVAFQENHF